MSWGHWRHTRYRVQIATITSGHIQIEVVAGTGHSLAIHNIISI